MFPLVLLVLLVCSLFCWFLALVGAFPPGYSGWLPFVAVLILAVAVFTRDARWPPSSS